jgi:hypothetical protein
MAGELVAWCAGLREVEGARERPHLTWAGLWSRVASLAGRDGDGVVQAARAGTSVRGEPIWAVSVDHGRGAAAGTVMIVAGLHAMEHVGPQTALALIERAAAGEGGWRGRRLVVVPVANPDGFLAVERALAEGKRRFFRANARGVDLNRNFAVSWDDRYAWNRLLGPIFSAGSAPLSEPESRALDGLAARERPGYVASLHAFGEWIFVPYAGRREPPPDEAELRAHAEAMASRMPFRKYRVVRLTQRTGIFQARGAELDHFYDRHGALSFLFEIGAGPSLLEPEGWLWPYRWYTPRADRLMRDVANVLPALDYLASAPPRSPSRADG